MGKIGTFLASLVAAVPAGFLTYFLVTEAFLAHFDVMGTMLKVLSIVTVATSSLTALLPFGILIFVKSAASPAKKKAAEDEGGVAEVAEGFDEDEDLGEVEEAMGDDESGLLVDAEDDEFADTEALEAESGDDLFVEGEADEFDDFDMLDEDEEERS